MIKIADYEKDIKRVGDVYESIYQWLIKEDPAYVTQIEEVATKFLEDELDLEKQYKESWEFCERNYQEIRDILHALEKEPNQTGTILFRIYKELFYYLYLEVQKVSFLYNTMINKVFFERKAELVYQEVYQDLCGEQKTNNFYLDYLEYIDTSTTYKYMKRSSDNRKRTPNLPDVVKENTKLKRFIEEVSLQKKWEVKYNQILDEEWVDLVVTLRKKIWAYLEVRGQMPASDEVKHCVWELLPYLDTLS